MNTPRSTAHLYKPLKDSSIRLITVKPRRKYGTKIECTLQTATLDNSLKYRALSYVWGSTSDPKTITVNGREFNVTRNLFEGLQQLRESMHGDKTLEVFPVWVDAICINQNDLYEKARQVPRMKDIYSQAREVLGWLGARPFLDPFIEGSPSAGYDENDISIGALFNHVNSEAERGNFDRNLIRTAMSLCKNVWFTRIWVVQEVVLSNKAPLLMGNRHVTDMDKFFQFIKSISVDPNEGTSMKNLTVMPAGSLWVTRQERGSTPVVVHKDHKTLAASLLEVIKIFSKQEATLPVDKIYAVLSLVSTERFPVDLTPNYALPLDQVHHAYARFLFQHTGDLTLLIRSMEKRDNIPSWVPDFSLGISYVPIPKSLAHPSFSADGHDMTIHGYHITVCTEDLDPAPRPDWYWAPGHVPNSEWNDIVAALDDITLETEPARITKLWGEFEAIQDEQSYNELRDYCELLGKLPPDAQFTRGLAKGIRKRFRDLAITWRDIKAKEYSNSPKDGIPHDMGSVIPPRVAEDDFVTQGDRQFSCKREIGVLKDDWVCFLHGFNRPVVLRPKDDKGDKFRFVGLCWPTKISDADGKKYPEVLFEGKDLRDFTLV